MSMSDVVADRAQAVRIRAEVSEADPDMCRFVCSAEVHPGGPFAFESVEAAAGSPLPQHLFELGVVTHVLVAGNVVTVCKRVGVPWGDLRKRIGAIIRELVTSAAPAILDSVPDLDGFVGDGGPRSEPELRKIIERLFEREVNPRVAAHGGSIRMVGLAGDTLEISMHGGCQGCSSSSVTVKASVEVMVKRVAPEITSIVDVTDHAAGTNPYFSDTSQGGMGQRDVVQRGPVRLARIDVEGD